MKVKSRLRGAIGIATVVVALLSIPVRGEEQGRSPVPEGINDRFLDPALKVEEWVNRFEVESREIFSGRAAIVAALKFSPGDRVADVGAGTGLFLKPFAEAVGAGGKVYALDISEKFVQHLRARAAEAGLKQVEARRSRPDSTGLPEASVNLAFVCDTYHHFEYHRAMLASIRRALRPGGQLVVIDFERVPGKSREWVLNHVRAGKDEFRKEIEAAGFRFVEEVAVPGLEENYLLRFTRE